MPLLPPTPNELSMWNIHVHTPVQKIWKAAVGAVVDEYKYIAEEGNTNAHRTEQKFRNNLYLRTHAFCAKAHILYTKNFKHETQYETNNQSLDTSCKR